MSEYVVSFVLNIESSIHIEQNLSKILEYVFDFLYFQSWDNIMLYKHERYAFMSNG